MNIFAADGGFDPTWPEAIVYVVLIVAAAWVLVRIT